MQATEGGINGVSSANIVYSAAIVDPTSQVCDLDPIVGTICRYTRTTFELGVGSIPSADLKITAASAELNTDIGTIPGFVFVRCLVDEVAGTSTCSEILPSGTISVQWAKTGTEFFFSQGVTQVEQGPITVKTSGTQLGQSAVVAGRMLGAAVLTTAAGLGSGSNVTITVTHPRPY